MIGAVLIILLGALLVLGYLFNQNMLMGAPGIVLVGIGSILIYFLRQRKHDYVVKHIGNEKKHTANCLNLYSNELKFEDMPKPEGFIWKCRNDNEYYYINWQPLQNNAIVPFILPDQQYYDPEVMAQRVIELPAHRKIFKRKVDLVQKLRPAFIVGAIIIMWIIIMTTTSPGGG